MDNKWRPINTAPKDGTWILLLGESGYVNRPYRAHVGCWGNDRWYQSEGCSFEDDGEPPTHWMSLPEPPRSAWRRYKGVTKRKLHMSWQPINTAPKNGKFIIIALIRYGDTVWRVSDAAHNGLLWYTKNGNQTFNPTHWMPLPEPSPKEGS